MPKSLMSISELIDAAFGEDSQNIVNFNLLQTILVILAKQLRLLQRRVEIDFDLGTIRRTSSISITELKLQATVPKRKKKNVEKNIEKNVDKNVEKNIGKNIEKKVGKNVEKSKDRVSTKSLGFDVQKSSEFFSLKSSMESSSHVKASNQSPSDKTKPTSENITKIIPSKGVAHMQGKFTSQERDHILETFEQQRERELRVVTQRANSREEAEKTPTPMASLDSMELQYEKLLVVERVPSDEIDNESSQDSKAVQLSVVTQDQFDNLAKIVEELQKKFGSIPKANLPDNAKLMHDLRKGASLTDAMAALQLSARLESAEKTLEQMISLITEVAIEKGIDLTKDIEIDPNVTKAIYEADSPQPVQESTRKSTARKHSKKSQSKATHEEIENIPKETTEGALEEIDKRLLQEQKDRITMLELKEAMKEVYNSIMKTVSNVTSKVTSNAEDALNLAHILEGKLNIVLSIDTRMTELEALISEYAEQINVLDTGLSSQMTNYQEQLTLMQHDLESGLEAMGEALANTGGDTTAATELNSNFTNLQLDFDIMNMKQKELKENQDLLSNNIQSLWKQIEVLVATKSDREEVADALRDKAGLGALNGLVNRQQFDAVRGDFEKRIGASYDKFNNQEIIWQKAIDDLLRELSEKADYVQVVSLRDNVNENLEKLRNRINFMMDIVGEPRAAAITKKLFRDAACLSCSSPAHMQLEEPSHPFLNVPRPHTIITEETKPKEDGDHSLCYPGKPIPHPPDPRSHFCHRYCGGSHTKIVTNVKRAPTEMIITCVDRHETNGKFILLTNTKLKLKLLEELKKENLLKKGSFSNSSILFVHGMQETPQQKPCIPCNLPKKDIQHLEIETDTSQHEIISDSVSTPLDFIQLKPIEEPSNGSISITPPLLNEENEDD